MSALLRAVIFKRTLSLPATLRLEREVSTVTFNQGVYTRQLAAREAVRNKVVNFAENAGLDAAGVEEVTVP
jgi:hypothetical protein